MKATFRLLALIVALALSNLTAAQVITGDVTGGGTVTGTVTSSNAWITANAIDGEMVNFWTLSGNAGDRLSLIVTSADIEFGVSVYRGVVDQMELLIDSFNNAGDFGDNSFIAGTNPATGAIGTTLLDVLLPTSGTYTIAVGGEAGFVLDGNYDYEMQVAVAAVPLPAAVWLFGSALFGLFRLQRRR